MSEPIRAPDAGGISWMRIARLVLVCAVVGTIVCYGFSAVCMFLSIGARYVERGPYRTDTFEGIYYNKVTKLGSTYEATGVRVDFGCKLLVDEAPGGVYNAPPAAPAPPFPRQPYLDASLFGAIGKEWRTRLAIQYTDWFASTRHFQTIGWPFRAWSSLSSPVNSRTVSLEAGVFVNKGAIEYLPIRPRVLPLIGNAIVWGALVYGASAMFGAARRSNRRRRGVCERCTYSLMGIDSGVCPECGLAKRS